MAFSWIEPEKQHNKLWNYRKRWSRVRKMLQQACTTLFFLIPKTVTSERPIALVLQMIRCEALRAPEVATWQYKYRIEPDATDGRSGGAERTVCWKWKGSNTRQGKKIQGAVALVLDLVKAIERVTLPVVWA